MMLKSNASFHRFANDVETDKDESAHVTTQLSTFIEERVLYFYSICSYDMRQWNIIFVAQWVILILQIMRFLSDAYVPYEWNNSVAKVVMSISDFVTEIPWVSQMTAYYITIGVFFYILLSAFFAALTHHYYEWVFPLYILRIFLFWANATVIPEIIPHFKMIFPCFSYSASSYSVHPFYPDLVCWHSAYIGYFILSIFISAGIMTITYLNTMCFYNAEVPNELQYGKQSLNNKYSGNTETAVFTLKMILLALNIAGHSSNWRMAVGALAFVFGCASTYHVVCVVPWWHDTTMTLFIFKGLVFTWTGLCAMLMVAFDDAEGVGMLYFLMFPVLLLAANMLLRWRFMCIAALSAHELDSPVLAILKLHTIVRALTLWLAQFGDVYIEMTPALQAEFDKCGHLSANVIEIAVERFPESVDLHILCAQYYMTVQANRVLAYRSLTLAEKAGGNLDNRFRCRAIRQALEAAAHAQKSEEVKAYTEFKARKEVAEGVLSDAMRSLVQFWTEVMQATPDVDKLATIGERARHQLDVTIAHFERLLQLNRQSIPVLRLYGVLCLEVLGDVARAQELFAQADSVVTNKRKVMLDVNYGSFLGAIPVDVDIFDDKNAVVSISMSPDTIGVVDSVNPAFAQLLGFASSKDVLGKNIKMVVPEPIRSYHDRYLRDYARTRISPVINKTCLVTAVHNHGHLLPCAWYLRWADEAVGQMIATLQPLVNPHEVAFFVDVHTWNITHATANFVSVFGFSKRDVLAQRVKFLDVLPELKDDYGAGQINEEIYGKLLSPRGYEGCGQHAITQQYFKIQCYLRVIPVYDTSMMFFRCEVTQVQKDDDVDDHVFISDGHEYLSDGGSEHSDTELSQTFVSRYNSVNIAYGHSEGFEKSSRRVKGGSDGSDSGSEESSTSDWRSPYERDGRDDRTERDERSERGGRGSSERGSRGERSNRSKKARALWRIVRKASLSRSTLHNEKREKERNIGEKEGEGEKEEQKHREKDSTSSSRPLIELSTHTGISSLSSHTMTPNVIANAEKPPHLSFSTGSARLQSLLTPPHASLSPAQSSSARDGSLVAKLGYSTSTDTLETTSGRRDAWLPDALSHCSESEVDMDTVASPAIFTLDSVRHNTTMGTYTNTTGIPHVRVPHLTLPCTHDDNTYDNTPTEEHQEYANQHSYSISQPHGDVSVPVLVPAPLSNQLHGDLMAPTASTSTNKSLISTKSSTPPQQDVHTTSPIPSTPSLFRMPRIPAIDMATIAQYAAVDPPSPSLSPSFRVTLPVNVQDGHDRHTLTSTNTSTFPPNSSSTSISTSTSTFTLPSTFPSALPSLTISTSSVSSISASSTSSSTPGDGKNHFSGTSVFPNSDMRTSLALPIDAFLNGIHTSHTNNNTHTNPNTTSSTHDATQSIVLPLPSHSLALPLPSSRSSMRSDPYSNTRTQARAHANGDVSSRLHTNAGANMDMYTDMQVSSSLSPRHAHSPAHSTYNDNTHKTAAYNDPTHTNSHVSLTNSALLCRRRNAAQKRLKAAITNDNIRTLRRLRWFTLFSCILAAVAAALVVMDALMTAADVQHIDTLIENLTISSQKQTYNIFMTLNLYTFHLFHRNPNATTLPDLLNVQKSTSAENMEYFYNQASTYATFFLERSLAVDGTSSESAKLHRLRNEDVLGMYMRDGKKAEKWDKDNMMSLKHAALYYSAAVQWSLYEKKEKVEDDLGYFFAVANFVAGTLNNAFELNTEYVVEEIASRGDYMFTVSIIVFIAASAGLSILGITLLIPLLLQVERSKARVLAIFLAIPQSVRKSLRVKAVRVYRLVEKVEETGRGMAGHDDDDEGEGEGEGGDNGDMDGGMSMAGSEMTSFSHLTTGSANKDAYAAIFRRYNTLRSLETGKDARNGVGVGKTYVITTHDDSGRRDGVIGAPEVLTSTNTHTLKGKIDANHADRLTSTDGAASDVYRFNNKSNGHSSKSKNDVYTHKARVERVDGVLSSHRGGHDGAPVRGGAGGAGGHDSGMPMTASSVMSGASIGSGNDRGRGRSAGDRGGVRYNVWTGAAMRMTASRFSIFVCIILAYFAILLILTHRMQNDVTVAVQHLAVGNNRNPHLGSALVYTMEHLFHNRKEQSMTNPLDPLTLGDETYAELAIYELEKAKHAMIAGFFGGVNGVSERISDSEQTSVFFSSVCDMDPEKFIRMYPEASMNPHILSTCADAAGGVLTHGLYTGFLFIYEQVHVVLQPQYNKILKHILTGETPTGDMVAVNTVKMAFPIMYTLYYDYMYHFIRYSNILQRQTAMQLLTNFSSVRYYLLAVYIALLFLSLLVLLRPITIVLGRSLSQSNAIMLLLPYQSIRLREIQSYIQDNLAKD